MNLYAMEWLVRERLDQAREFAARQAMVRKALGDRPGLRLGTWLQDRAVEPDVEAKRAAA